MKTAEFTIPVIDDTTLERNKTLAAEAENQARKKLEMQTKLKLVQWGVPPKDIERVSVGEMRMTEAVVAMEDFESGDKCILVLAGKRGSGKTTAAAKWMTKPGPYSPWIEARSPLFVPVFKLQSMNRFSGDEMRGLELARRLVIDDLGNEYLDSKNAFASFMDGIINMRYANQLPVVITTNLDAKEFKASYGERVADRIRESGVFVGINEESLRTAK